MTENEENKIKLNGIIDRQIGQPILILPQISNDWKEVAGKQGFMRVLYPDLGGLWRICVVPETKPFPESWAGLTDVELDKVTNIPGCSYCNKNREAAGHRTLEGAIEMAKASIFY